MGTSQAEKQQTHEAILDAAAALLREGGTAAVTIASVMGAVGLTHGGFYAHFGNRDELLAAASRRAFDDGRARLDLLASKFADVGDIGAFLAVYLSAQHVNSPGIGCAAPALASDTARNVNALGSVFAEGIGEYLAALRSWVEPDLVIGDHSTMNSHEVADDDVALVLCASIGAVLVARAAGELLGVDMPQAVHAALRRRVLPHLESGPAV